MAHFIIDGILDSSKYREQGFGESRSHAVMVPILQETQRLMPKVFSA